MIFENFITFMQKVMCFAGFVKHNSSFKKNLTLEEEKEYFRKFKAGDNDARTVLIEHNLRLVAHIVKKYSNAGEADDYISVGTIGLIKAINSYDESKGNQLSTYASRCIENEILMLIRSSKKHKEVSSLDERLGYDKDGNDIILSEVLENKEVDVIEETEKNILMQKLIEISQKELDAREYEIIAMRYGIGNKPSLTQQEVADKLKISRSYVSRLEKHALSVIKKIALEQEIYVIL